MAPVFSAATPSPRTIMRFVDVTLIGECGEHIWLRDGARPGDTVCVTGDLGRLGGRHAARLGGHEEPLPGSGMPLRCHGVAEAAALSPVGADHRRPRHQRRRSLQDAGHLCERSRRRYRNQCRELPISDGDQATAGRAGARAAAVGAEQAGEDFELLFTAPAEHSGGASSRRNAPIM